MNLDEQSNAEKQEIYPHCYRKENAPSLEDICSKCPIPSRISGGLPRIKAEIETRRQGDTPSGFIRYCEQALNNHVNKAGQFANDLVNPAKNKSIDVGQALEIKFWNLALCDLYKSELAATSLPLNQYEPTALLPSAVAKRLNYFTALLEVCKKLKYPDDVAQTLRAAYEEQKSRGLYDLEDFMERLPLYVLAELPTETRAILSETLMKSLRGHLRLFRLKPETWPLWSIMQRVHLVSRQQDIEERIASIESGERAQQDAQVLESWRAQHGEEAANGIANTQQFKIDADLARHQNDLARVKSILVAIDTAEEAGRTEVRANELDETHNTLSPSNLQVIDSPFTPLLLSYTIDNLTTLLVRLGLVDANNGQSTPTASPGAWIGVIYGLLDATPPRLRNNKAAIQRAFRDHFGAKVGERAVQAGPGKRGSEAERFRGSTLALLRE